MLKRPAKKKGRLPCARTRARVCVHVCEVCVFRMRFNLNKIFAGDV